MKTAEDFGWRGDSIEAEAFAYLAARTSNALPLSFPKTTGVPKPMTGGRIVSSLTLECQSSAVTSPVVPGSCRDRLFRRSSGTPEIPQ